MWHKGKNNEQKPTKTTKQRKDVIAEAMNACLIYEGPRAGASNSDKQSKQGKPQLWGINTSHAFTVIMFITLYITGE